jgi:hypothetical protein
MCPMQTRKMNFYRHFFQTAILLVNLFSLISCGAVTSTSAPATIEPSIINTTTKAALAATLQPTQPAELTPPELPAIYESKFLNPLDIPRTYITDTCKYLRSRWNPSNATPGTVVMIIMFHGIYRGPVEESGGVNVNDLGRIMDQIHNQGFQAIRTEEFLAFMERNIKIPARSVLIIQDDRHHADDFNKNFRDYWVSWKWPVINGWPSQPDTPESLWQENVALENEGWVDHQAQGVMIGTFLTDDSSKAVITRELQGSLDAFAQYYGKTPLAFIWPGGGFGMRPVEAARQLGFQLGFTSNSRGPVMYNWVPLADQVDPNRPAYIPEAGIADPLMTLPRYSPYEVVDSIDKVRIMGNEAAAYAQANKATELEYYNTVCKPTLGPIPSP